MNKKQLTALIICITVIIISTALYVLDGNTIAIGAGVWNADPIDYFDDDDSTEIIKTIYLGENGKDGVVVLHISTDSADNKHYFYASYFKSKLKSENYVYALNTTEGYKMPFDENIFALNNNNDKHAVFLTQLSVDVIIDKYPDFNKSDIKTVIYTHNGEEYTVRYIIKSFENKEEAQSYKATIN